MSNKKNILVVPKYILSIDSGGSNLRALLFDKEAKIVAKEKIYTPWISPISGAQEHDPIMLFDALVTVVKNLLRKRKIDPKEIVALSITNQRASFLLWEKNTGKPITNLISWADVRAASTCEEMNNDKRWRAIKSVAALLYKISRSPIMLTTRLLHFTTDHASTRLKWILDITPNLRERCKAGEVLFGTLDSWFIYNLTKGEKHLSDISNAAASSLFNPFSLKWNSILCNLFDIPLSIFPTVIDCDGDFGKCHQSFFNHAIPIRGIIGDQMGALFGHCCFDSGDVKISGGSGAFVDLNVGDKPKVSKNGLFPLVAWSLSGKIHYMLEGYVATAGTFIDWLDKEFEIAKNGHELDKLASKVQDSGGLFIIPAANGLRYPYFNPSARAAIFGLSLSTKKSHLALATLEGIGLRIIDIIKGMEKDTKIPIKAIKVDGGLSNSDVLIQTISDNLGQEILRSQENDMAATGAAYIAGLATSFYKDLEQLKQLSPNYHCFCPKITPSQRTKKINNWKNAIKSLKTLRIS